VESGRSSLEAMAIARDKDIPLIRAGLISVNKHFDPNTSSKYIDSAHELYYRSRLLDENAQISLIFTPENKFLSAVRIQWAGVSNKDGFRHIVFDTLKSKYGNYAKKGKQIFFETLFWPVDKANQISMKTSSNQILVEYIDLPCTSEDSRKSQSKKTRIDMMQNPKTAASFEDANNKNQETRPRTCSDAT
jgi:hypothetical protein